MCTHHSVPHSKSPRGRVELVHTGLDEPMRELLPFSRLLPYNEMVVHLPMANFAPEGLKQPGSAAISALRRIPNPEIHRMRRAIKRFGRLLTWATNPNDLLQPDALVMTLIAVWEESRRAR